MQLKLVPLLFTIPPENIRQTLLASARASDPDFPADNSGLVLTHFSHVCELFTNEGETIYVADRRTVVAGMSAPRGLNYITFFAEDFTYLGKFLYIKARPLWCEGGKLYLFGNLDGGTVSDGNNTIDVSGGWRNVRFYPEKAYKSSS